MKTHAERFEKEGHYWPEAREHKVSTCANGHVHVELNGPGGVILAEKIMSPEEAFDFAQEILSRYDRLAGIA